MNRNLLTRIVSIFLCFNILFTSMAPFAFAAMDWGGGGGGWVPPSEEEEPPPADTDPAEIPIEPSLDGPEPTSPPECNPDCSNSWQVCSGESFDDGCGGTCWGSSDCSPVDQPVSGGCSPDCSVDDRVCEGQSYDDGCGGRCNGDKDCSESAPVSDCIPSWRELSSTKYCISCSQASVTKSDGCGETLNVTVDDSSCSGDSSVCASARVCEDNCNQEMDICQGITFNDSCGHECLGALNCEIPTPTPTVDIPTIESKTCECINDYFQGNDCGEFLHVFCSPTPTPVPIPTPSLSQIVYGGHDWDVEGRDAAGAYYASAVGGASTSDQSCQERVIDSCYRTVCDQNLHKNVCRQIVESQSEYGGCSTKYDQPGAATDEDCGLTLGTPCQQMRLNEYDHQECDYNSGTLIWIENWQDEECNQYKKPGASAGGSCLKDNAIISFYDKVLSFAKSKFPQGSISTQGEEWAKEIAEAAKNSALDDEAYRKMVEDAFNLSGEERDEALAGLLISYKVVVPTCDGVHKTGDTWEGACTVEGQRTYLKCGSDGFISESQVEDLTCSPFLTPTVAPYDTSLIGQACTVPRRDCYSSGASCYGTWWESQDKSRIECSIKSCDSQCPSSLFSIDGTRPALPENAENLRSQAGIGDRRKVLGDGESIEILNKQIDECSSREDASRDVLQKCADLADIDLETKELAELKRDIEQFPDCEDVKEGGVCELTPQQEEARKKYIKDLKQRQFKTEEAKKAFRELITLGLSGIVEDIGDYSQLNSEAKDQFDKSGLNDRKNERKNAQPKLDPNDPETQQLWHDTCVVRHDEPEKCVAILNQMGEGMSSPYDDLDEDIKQNPNCSPEVRQNSPGDCRLSLEEEKARAEYAQKLAERDSKFDSLFLKTAMFIGGFASLPGGGLLKSAVGKAVSKVTGKVAERFGETAAEKAMVQAAEDAIAKLSQAEREAAFSSLTRRVEQYQTELLDPVKRAQLVSEGKFTAEEAESLVVQVGGEARVVRTEAGLRQIAKEQLEQERALAAAQLAKAEAERKAAEAAAAARAARDAKSVGAATRRFEEAEARTERQSSLAEPKKSAEPVREPVAEPQKPPETPKAPELQPAQPQSPVAQAVETVQDTVDDAVRAVTDTAAQVQDTAQGVIDDVTAKIDDIFGGGAKKVAPIQDPEAIWDQVFNEFSKESVVSEEKILARLRELGYPEDKINFWAKEIKINIESPRRTRANFVAGDAKESVRKLGLDQSSLEYRAELERDIAKRLEGKFKPTYIDEEGLKEEFVRLGYSVDEADAAIARIKVKAAAAAKAKGGGSIISAARDGITNTVDSAVNRVKSLFGGEPSTPKTPEVPRAVKQDNNVVDFPKAEAPKAEPELRIAATGAPLPKQGEPAVGGIQPAAQSTQPTGIVDSVSKKINDVFGGIFGKKSVVETRDNIPTQIKDLKNIDSSSLTPEMLISDADPKFQVNGIVDGAKELERVYPESKFKVFSTEGSSAVLFEDVANPGVLYKVYRVPTQDAFEYSLKEANKITLLSKDELAPRLIEYRGKGQSKVPIVVMEKVDFDRQGLRTLTAEQREAEIKRAAEILRKNELFLNDVEFVVNKKTGHLISVDSGGFSPLNPSQAGSLEKAVRDNIEGFIKGDVIKSELARGGNPVSAVLRIKKELGDLGIIDPRIDRTIKNYSFGTPKIQEKFDFPFNKDPDGKLFDIANRASSGASDIELKTAADSLVSSGYASRDAVDAAIKSGRSARTSLGDELLGGGRMDSSQVRVPGAPEAPKPSMAVLEKPAVINTEEARKAIEEGLKQNSYHLGGFESQVDSVYQGYLDTVSTLEKAGKLTEQANADLLEIASKMTLKGKEIVLNPKPLKYSAKRMADKAKKLMEVYKENPSLAEEITAQQIVGGHGSTSGSLLGVLDIGLKPQEVLEKKKIIIGGEGLGSAGGSGEAVSFAYWEADSVLKTYSGSEGRITVETLNKKIKDLKDMIAKESEGTRKETLKIIERHSEEMRDYLLSHPSGDLQADLVRENFPVVYLAKGRNLGFDNAEVPYIGLQDEFIVYGGLDVEDISVVLVPREKVDFVKNLVKEKGRDIKVYPREDWFGASAGTAPEIKILSPEETGIKIQPKAITVQIGETARNAAQKVIDTAKDAYDATIGRIFGGKKAAVSEKPAAGVNESILKVFPSSNLDIEWNFAESFPQNSVPVSGSTAVLAPKTQTIGGAIGGVVKDVTSTVGKVFDSIKSPFKRLSEERPKVAAPDKPASSVVRDIRDVLSGDTKQPMVLADSGGVSGRFKENADAFEAAELAQLKVKLTPQAQSLIDYLKKNKPLIGKEIRPPGPNAPDKIKKAWYALMYEGVIPAKYSDIDSLLPQVIDALAKHEQDFQTISNPLERTRKIMTIFLQKAKSRGIDVSKVNLDKILDPGQIHILPHNLFSKAYGSETKGKAVGFFEVRSNQIFIDEAYKGNVNVCAHECWHKVSDILNPKESNFIVNRLGQKGYHTLNEGVNEYTMQTAFSLAREKAESVAYQKQVDGIKNIVIPTIMGRNNMTFTQAENIVLDAGTNGNWKSLFDAVGGDKNMKELVKKIPVPANYNVKLDFITPQRLKIAMGVVLGAGGVAQYILNTTGNTSEGEIKVIPVSPQATPTRAQNTIIIGPSLPTSTPVPTAAPTFAPTSTIAPTWTPIPKKINLKLVEDVYAEGKTNSDSTNLIDGNYLESLVKQQLIKMDLEEFGELSSEDIKNILLTDVLPSSIAQSNSDYVLTTGKAGVVEGEIERNQYEVKIDSLPGVDIKVPAEINTTNGFSVIIPVAVKKGSGKVTQTPVVDLSSSVILSDSEGSRDNTSKVSLVVFSDENDNGRLDKDEKILPWAGVTVTLTKVIQEKNIALLAGWNLINLTNQPTRQMRASDLLGEIAAQGGYATTVSTLVDGAWESYVARGDKTYSDDNFAIESGKAYFVKALKKSNLSFKGKNFDAPVKLDLNSGWNAVAMPKTSKDYKASTLIDEINTKQADADSVTRFSSGLWDTFIKKKEEEYGNDFMVEYNRGYLLRLEKRVEFTP